MNTGSRWVLAQFVTLALIGLSVVLLGRAPMLVTTVVAVALFVLGQGMALAAAIKMRQHISAHPAPSPGAKLLRDGIYGLVRHPMYGGVILMAAAVSIFDLNLAAGVLTLVLAGVFHFKSRYEESLLVESFLGYADYLQRVRNRFIPWVI